MRVCEREKEREREREREREGGRKGGREGDDEAFQPDLSLVASFDGVELIDEAALRQVVHLIKAAKFSQKNFSTVEDPIVNFWLLSETMGGGHKARKGHRYG